METSAQRKWRLANPDKTRALAREQQRRRRANGKAIEYERQRKYGISPVDQRAMLLSQEGKCKICRKEKRLVLDHCHTSGKIRGFICNRCNSVVALLDEDMMNLERLKEYIS